MLIRKLAISACAVVILSASLACGNDRKNVFVPLPLDIKKLQINYQGHDLHRIFYSLNKLINKSKNVFEKTEYETTDRYNKRIDSLKKRSLVDIMTLESEFAFRVPKLETKYDADTESLTIQVPASPYIKYIYNDNIDVDYSSSTIDGFVIRESKSYPLGMNSYGAKVRISKTEYEVCKLAIKNYFDTDKFIITSHIDSAVTNVKLMDRPNSGLITNNGLIYKLSNISANKAKKITKTGSIILLYELTSPYLTVTRSVTDATVSNPTEDINTYHNIIVNIKGILYFDKTTGEILFEAKLGQVRD